MLQQSAMRTALLSLMLVALPGGPEPWQEPKKSDVPSVMRSMSAEVRRIDELLRSDTVTRRGQQQVIDALMRLRADAAELGEPRQRLAHPKIDTNLEKLRDDVDRALEAAAREPPNYYLAGSITAACTYCHAAPR